MKSIEIFQIFGVLRIQ